MSKKPGDLSAAGRIFLAPQPTALPQFWLNIGYDSEDGFQIPEYLPEFEDICSQEQYDLLMDDIRDYFKKNSIDLWSSVCVYFTCCSTDYLDKRRRKFDAGFDALIRRHAAISRKFEKGVAVSGWLPGTLKWSYGFSAPITPHKAYDSKGNVLDLQIKSTRTPVWPPPYYNVIFAIPVDLHKSFRSKWAGEIVEEKDVKVALYNFAR